MLQYNILERIDASPDFVRQVCFLDKTTFHVNGVVNRYNCRIWSSQNQYVAFELEGGSLKVNVWADLRHTKLIGLFFFYEETMTGCSYLDMLELYARPQLPPPTILQKYGVPPHVCLNREMAGRWIGRGGPIAWPPRLPDLTLLDFFLWCYV
jgi:hypothetical protein